MFGQIWPTAGRLGVISDKKAQFLKNLSGQKWGNLGNFGIKHLWGLSGVLRNSTADAEYELNDHQSALAAHFGLPLALGVDFITKALLFFFGYHYINKACYCVAVVY